MVGGQSSICFNAEHFPSKASKATGLRMVIVSACRRERLSLNRVLISMALASTSTITWFLSGAEGKAADERRDRFSQRSSILASIRCGKALKVASIGVLVTWLKRVTKRDGNAAIAAIAELSDHSLLKKLLMGKLQYRIGLSRV